jgi:hypothetical protein
MTFEEDVTVYETDNGKMYVYNGLKRKDQK